MKYLWIVSLIFFTNVAYANKIIPRVLLGGGFEVNKFEVDKQTDSNFEGYGYGGGFELRSAGLGYGLGISLLYTKSELKNKANNSITKETFEHSEYEVGAKIYALDLLLGAHLILIQSDLNSVNSGIKAESGYKGLGYGFDLGYQLNLNKSIKLIPSAYYSFIELDADSSGLSRDGNRYGVRTHLVIEFE